MINLMVGSSGSGKSYEACVYHILAAVKRGRKVITNLPLSLPKWAALDAHYVDLIELRTRPQMIRGTWEPTREEGAFNVGPEDTWQKPASLARCFAGVWDYYDDWVDPETGQGPLYVVDEAQNVIPARGCSQDVEEWAALHRHWVCDVLYITQSYRKLSVAIRDNVQMVYRLRKMTAWGKPDSYIRKVQDGVRGEVLNEGQREYEKRYFGLYRSHTQGGSGSESGADDVRPWWKHWTFIGAAGMLVLAVVIFAAAGSPNILKPKVSERKVLAKGTTYEDVSQLPSGSSKVERPSVEDVNPKEPVTSQEPEHPFSGRSFHIIGQMEQRGRAVYEFVVAQNGQRVSNISGSDLEQLGYTVRPGVPCAAEVSFGTWHRWIICDAPQVAVVQAMAPAQSQSSAATSPGG